MIYIHLHPFKKPVSKLLTVRILFHSPSFNKYINQNITISFTKLTKFLTGTFKDNHRKRQIMSRKVINICLKSYGMINDGQAKSC